jgi:hypothetical protein
MMSAQNVDGADFITLEEVKEKVKEYSPILSDQIVDSGIGESLWIEAKENRKNKGCVSVKNFIEWWHSTEHGLKVIKTLCLQFKVVEMLEFHGDKFKVRVDRGNRTIGFVFGLMETNKKEFGTQEYSVSQTTLEQIF